MSDEKKPAPSYCELCGKRLDPAKLVWLELDIRTDTYTSDLVPEQYSQGAFTFGPDCARRAQKAHNQARGEEGQ